MKTSVNERYAVVIENEGRLEAPYWFETLLEARKYAKEVRSQVASEVGDPNQIHEILIIKVLHI